MPDLHALSHILPRPREVQPQGTGLVLSPRASILHTGGEAANAAVILREMIAREFALGLPLAECEALPDGARVALTDGEAPAGPVPLASPPDDPEGYSLCVDASGAYLAARTHQGLLWAAATLRQLLAPEGAGMRAPGVLIRDWPRYRWRGFMIDSGRSPNSLPKIKRIIRICSAFKLNTLVFREGDDELNAVRYRSNPLGSENRHALTMEQVLEMIGYARERGISVVPEIESLGHSTAKGLHYPHLVSGGFEHDYGFVSHIRKSHLNPGDSESYALLRSIYEEWLALIPEPMLHLGLDEVRLPAEEQAEHMEGLLALLDCLPRPVTPIVWSDAPATPPAWRSRTVRCLWNYGDGAPNTPDNPHLVKQGAPGLLSGESDEPVWMAGGSGSLHTPNSKSGYGQAVENLLSWARWGENSPNASGLLAVQWSGNATDDWLPDFLTAADFGWNVPAGVVSAPDQLARVRACLSRLGDAVSPHPSEVDPPCWDGIWLDGADWGADILSGRTKS